MFAPVWKSPKSLFGLECHACMNQALSFMPRIARHRGHTRPALPFPAHPGYIDVIIEWDAGMPEHTKRQIERRHKLVPIGVSRGDLQQYRVLANQDIHVLENKLYNTPQIVQASVSPSGAGAPVNKPLF
jgi:hypothetical protein